MIAEQPAVIDEEFAADRASRAAVRQRVEQVSWHVLRREATAHAAPYA